MFGTRVVVKPFEAKDGPNGMFRYPLQRIRPPRSSWNAPESAGRASNALVRWHSRCNTSRLARERFEFVRPVAWARLRLTVSGLAIGSAPRIDRMFLPSV
jgi:hypothetical protein